MLPQEDGPRLQIVDVTEEFHGKPKIVVVGIGGCGCNAIDRMLGADIIGVEYIAMNTDLQALQNCEADLKVQLGPKLTGGLGAGGNVETGESSAEESKDEIIESMQDCSMVFIAAGMGGGTGTGAAPVVARIARELSAITVGVVTRPFEIEGAVKKNRSEQGISALRKEVDTLIVIPNDSLRREAGDEETLFNAFERGNRTLKDAVEGIANIISSPGLMNLDFQDIKKVITTGGGAMMGTGCCNGEHRASEAATRAISDPLLENVSIEGAKSLLVSIQASAAMKFSEFHEAVEIVTRAVGPQADVSLGTSIVESMEDRLKVTVIATGFGEVEDHDLDSLDMRLADSLSGQSSVRAMEREGVPFILGAARTSDKEDRKKQPPFFRR
ncbi:MAG: cell division protein FtsZ [Candidatus Fermentibacteraceae bacterium]|nr:cell division protein FtsZ [Candidatus Fermentibacteraceae bacterium]